ncbi:MAG: response regulator [Candidatus Cohnella colombiensis]|uniref:Response regulator n=1 Tax=Candidatus Cohnella colombiensis TaxID=3121368 RepID=A0AA95EZ30_9BACL|nr:MAG: response regulator [Cohnella sp.]
MKLLIVDDEQIEREGLEAILRKGFPDSEIKQAKNGKKAIELTHEYAPDIILMDIKMPGMSGLEAAQHIHEHYPTIKIVMVTAYEMFEYARQAIRIGVEDYILKPSKASDIVETVRVVIDRLEEERKQWSEFNIHKEQLLRMMPVVEADVVTQLLFDHVHEVHLDEMISLLGVDATREGFVMLIVLSPKVESEPFYRNVKEQMKQLKNGWVGAKSGRHIPIIVFREASKSYRGQASSIVQQLLLLQEDRGGAEIFVGIGNVYDSLDQVRLSYQEALISSADITLPSKHRFYVDIPDTMQQQSDNLPPYSEKQFLEQIRTGQWDEVRRFVSDIISRHENNASSLVQAEQSVMEALWLVHRLLQEMGVEVDKPMFSYHAQDYRNLRTETDCLLDKQIQTITMYQERFKPDVVQQMKRYIIENSQEDISLEMIARKVDLSPFYISKVFKEQLGVNYIDFLTECRIEKAKQLMSDPELSLKEITFEVGYNDPNYFSKVFKKISGVSPTEYRKLMLGKKI